MNLAAWLSDGPLVDFELFLGLGLVFAIFFYFALRNPIVGLIGFLFLVLTRVHDFGESMHLSGITIVLEAIIFFSLVLQWLRRRYPLSFIGPQSFLLFAFVGYAWISSLTIGKSLYEVSGRILIKEFLVIFFIFIVTQNAIRNRKDFNNILRTVVFSGLALCILCLIETFLTGAGGFVYTSEFNGEQIRLAGGMGWNPNGVAAFLAMIFPLAYFLLPVEKSGKIKLFYLVAIPLTIGTIFLTYSRAGFLYLAITFVFILTRRYKSRYVLGLSVILVAIFVFLPEIFWLRMGTIATDREGTGRIILFQAALKLFLENPLTGVGYGASVYLMQPYTLGRFHGLEGPHNLYLTILAEMGLVNFFVFSLMLLATFLDLNRVRRHASALGDIEMVRICEAFFICLVVYLTAGLFIDNLHTILFYVYLALVLVFKKRLQEWTGRLETSVTPAKKFPVELQIG